MAEDVTLSTDAVLELLQSVAAEVITPRFRSLSNAQIDEKKPGDLVTVADHEAEELITRALLDAYPDAVVLGEEAYAGDKDLLPRFRAAEHGFTVDPVDGTKNFVNGSQGPCRDGGRGGRVARRCAAGSGSPSTSSPGWPSAVAAYDETASRSPREPAGDQPQGATSIWSRRGRQPEGLPALIGSWLCCGVDYPKLIEGEADYLLYGHTNPWDHLPGTLMVREAGGAAAHRDGTPYSATSEGGGLVVASDPATLDAGPRSLRRASGRRSDDYSDRPGDQPPRRCISAAVASMSTSHW